MRRLPNFPGFPDFWNLRASVGGDSTPGGASSVWMWEAGQGVLWESDSFMLTE
jgi:hypothetical protein